MRCTRCDRPAVPQATGLTTDGRFVFGWCVVCLEQTGCRDIVVARPRLRRPKRLSLKSALGPDRFRAAAGRTARRGPLDDRLRVMAAVALVLALWGLALFAVGLNLRSRIDPRTASPLGNGTPALLIGGGGSTAAVGLGLWAMITGPAFVRSRRGVMTVQIAAVVLGLAALAVGLTAVPRRLRLPVVGFASTALALLLAARWLWGRCSQPATLRFRRPR